MCFKYTIYLLLTMDIYHFFVDEYSAFALTFADGYTLTNFLTGYNATIDTVAWVVLLYLFELETSILEDEKIVGWVKWSLHGVRIISYLFIISAFYRYISRYDLFVGVEPFLMDDLCSLVGSSYTFAVTMDEYIPWTQQICASMTNEPLLRFTDTNIISTIPQHNTIVHLAIIDIINAGTWLLVVLALEFDVWLQLKGKLTPQIMTISKWFKVIIYSVLIGCLIAWAVIGEILDIFDAFLWLLGFFFIELNLFDWNAETNAEKEQETH
tara:strand:+ start:47432 stop:48235 length:804 start_codon:yes stop_codon:yes gene_type:complete